MFVFINPDILKPVICINKKQSNVHKWIDATPQNEGGGVHQLCLHLIGFVLEKPKRKPLQLFNGDEIVNFVIFKQ